MKSRHVHYCLLAASVLTMLMRSVVAQDAEQTPQREEQAQPQSLQRLFVSDKLVLNVYAEPDQGGARVATIETGDVVTELESAGNFVRVRLEDGREGWVGASYLTAEIPAAARLHELQREQKTVAATAEKQSAEEITRLKKETAALQAQLKELQAAAPASTPATSEPVAAAETTTRAAKNDHPPQQAAQAFAVVWTTPWLWPFTVVLVMVWGLPPAITRWPAASDGDSAG